MFSTLAGTNNDFRDDKSANTSTDISASSEKQWTSVLNDMKMPVGQFVANPNRSKNEFQDRLRG
jgi:hypothetical protein